MASGRARVPTYRDFYSDVAEELRPFLPPDLREFESQRMGGVFKVFYDAPRQHFKLWFRDGGLEVAFHLEGHEDDEPVLRVLERRMNGIRKGLGGDVRLEPFGRDWVHLYEHWRGASRQPGLASDAAERLAEFVRLIEPLRRSARPAGG
jgi:hypothetical protein